VPTALTAPEILRKLRAKYRPPRTFLDWDTPLDLLIATILSAQCTDARVNIVTKNLFHRFRTPQDYLSVPRSVIEAAIHSCGTYRNKARFIQELCAILLAEHDGKVPQTMDALIKLPGVGRKTASIILYACFGKNEGIAVDTHVMRLAQRLGLSRHADPKRIELDLMSVLPPKQWGTLTTLLISHGRAVCTARNRQCGACIFKKTCLSSLVEGRKDCAQPKRSGMRKRKR
jgi:endonuclease-3